MEKITRRSFFGKSASAGAVVAAAALPTVAEASASAEYTAIPTETVDKIKAWQADHREVCRAAQAYSVGLRVKPIDKDASSQRFTDMCHAENAVRPIREAMIMALLKL